MPSVEQYCDEIDVIAGRLDHALPPVSAVFPRAGPTELQNRSVRALDQALTSLRDFDDKAHLAYVLNFAAHDALARVNSADPHGGDRGADGRASDVANHGNRRRQLYSGPRGMCRWRPVGGDRPRSGACRPSTTRDAQRAGKRKPGAGGARRWLRAWNARRKHRPSTSTEIRNLRRVYGSDHRRTYL